MYISNGPGVTIICCIIIYTFDTHATFINKSLIYVLAKYIFTFFLSYLHVQQLMQRTCTCNKLKSMLYCSAGHRVEIVKGLLFF